MPTETTFWLVRTRAGEILGPYTQKELQTELKENHFSSEDEIAPSEGHWISAQALLHRDAEEFTQTMTRSRVVTESVSVTPTTSPDFLKNRNTESQFEVPTLSQPSAPIPSAPPSEGKSRFSPKWRWGFVIVFSLILSWFLVQSQRSPLKKDPSAQNSPSLHADMNTPFLKKVLYHIRIGEREEALKMLRTHHQLSTKKNMAYLVPYAALLVTQGESSARARRLLEQVLELKGPAHLIAEAHLWLGYILLTEDKGDFGVSHFQETLQINPKHAAARFNLGRAYLKQDKHKKALEYFQFAELEAPDMWLIHIYKGRARKALSQMQGARFAFMTAVQTSQDRWLSYIYFALFSIREPLAAQNILTKMLTRDPHYEINSPPPLGFFQENVNYSEYEDAFLEVTKRGSRKLQDFGKLYLGYLKNGRGSAEGKRLIRLGESGDLMAKVIALKVLLDNDASPKALRKGLKRLPVNLSEFGYYAYVLRGEAQLRLGRTNKAEKDIKRALLLEPKAAIARLAYANFLKKINRSKEAQAEIKSLLNYHPNYIPAIVESQKF